MLEYWPSTIPERRVLFRQKGINLCVIPNEGDWIRDPHYSPFSLTDQSGLSKGRWVERWINVVRLVGIVLEKRLILHVYWMRRECY